MKLTLKEYDASISKISPPLLCDAIMRKISVMKLE